MSGGVLARALAAREGAYFLDQSKKAVGDLITKNKILPPPSSSPPSSTSSVSSPPLEELASSPACDVLPEVLRHSLPLSPPSSSPTSSFSASSKWAVRTAAGGSRSPRGDAAANPLRDYVALPQVTFGPKRWELPQGSSSILASTANELRGDRYDQVNPEKLKAAAEGLALVGKAFLVATAIVFGGSTFALVLATSKLQLQSTDDIKEKGRDIFQPKVETFRKHVVPLQDWAKNLSRKWHIEARQEMKDNAAVNELSKILGSKPRT